MIKEDKDEFVKLISDALNDVVIPALEDMEGRLASKEELQEVKHELSMQIDSLDRKFDAQQNRLDRMEETQEKHGKRITVLENKVLAI